MSKTYVPKELRRRIAEHARHRCGYCLTSQKITGMHLDIEHIIPEARGGKTEEDNLWLACADCNEFKGDRLEGLTHLQKKLCNCLTLVISAGMTISPGQQPGMKLLASQQ